MLVSLSRNVSMLLIVDGFNTLDFFEQMVNDGLIVNVYSTILASSNPL